jgi:predicted DCC family thiol-disulfide oxidoreductase YuxK
VGTAPSLCIYDGDCGFCTRCVDWARRRSDVEFVPFQRTDLASHGITPDQAAAAVQCVRNGQVVSGARAVAAVLRASRGGWQVLGWLMRVPGINVVADLAYRAVARNRHRLPGPAACAIEPGGKPPTTES